MKTPMKLFHNPIHKKGFRNVFCPYYGDCLDYVIEKSWEYWNCFACRHKYNERARPQIQDMVSDANEYYNLPKL